MIEITPIQAADFLKLGYKVKCYVDLPRNVEIDVQGTKTRSLSINSNGKLTRASGKQWSPETQIGRSVTGRVPSKGKLGILWGMLDSQLWGDDVTAIYSRSHIEGFMKKHGNQDMTIFSYLLNKCKCIRVITQETL